MSELQQFCMSCGGAISYTADQAGTSIFCMHCGQKNQLKEDSATPPEPSQSPPPPPAINDTPEEIFLFIDNQQHGPYSEANLSEYLKAGQITPETLVWWEGKQGWEPLSQQTELNLGLTSSLRESGLAPTAVAPERPMAMESPGDGRVDGVAGNTDEQGGPAEKHGDGGEEYYEENYHEENPSVLWDNLKGFAASPLVGGAVSLSLCVVLIYSLFFAEGCAEKKEMADLKQMLETVYLPAESAFLFTLDSQTSHYDLTPGVSDTLYSYSPQAIADRSAAATKFIMPFAINHEDGHLTFIRMDLEFKTEKVKELFQKLNKVATVHAREWALWGETRGIYTPSQIYAKEELLYKKRIWYAGDRENLLKSLDKTFQEYGLGPLKFDGHTLQKYLDSEI